MDLGLGNLATLKPWLLPPDALSDTSFDAALQILGKGVASALEKYCGRKFGRSQGAVFTVPGPALVLIVDRYPIEAFTKLEYKSIGSDAVWNDMTDMVSQWDWQTGVVELAGALGTSQERIRVTYNGGYFYETLEPTDTGYPTAQPTGSYELPDDLQLAWLQQCAAVWELRHKLGIALATVPEAGKAAIGGIKLTDGVIEMLNPYRRMALF